MTPTPSPHSSFHEHFRFNRIRRQRTANAYTAANQVTPTQVQTQTPQPQTETPSARLALPSDDEGDIEDIEHEEDGDLDDEVEYGGHEAHEGDEDEAGEEEGGIEEVPMELEPDFDPASLGLKEIGNLASWTVSTCKPGSGVEALRDEDTQLFWQSDGPQPHHLNIHFSRLVSILSIRIFLDFEQDESYTPTRISLLAGTGYHDLIPFAQLEFAQPKGWIDVPLEHVGGGEEGKMLKTFLVQVKIIENHQNGKDTHVRGLKVYARDDRIGRSGFPTMNGFDKARRDPLLKRDLGAHIGEERGWILEPEWMGEPELR